MLLICVNLLVLNDELKSLGHCDASVFSSCLPYSDKAGRNPIKFSTNVKLLREKQNRCWLSKVMFTLT